jgi:aminoglycoside N3'-acetyltransferase
VLLLGVGHEANTTLHLAELVFGVPYRIRKSVTVMEGGKAVRVEYGENDHCCERFRQMDVWLRARRLQSEGPVGHGRARLARSRDVVDVAVEHLRREPLVFLHGSEAACAACDEARASIHAGANPALTTPRDRLRR